MDAPTAIYYTLSTVAQTLAGALAILVAVVLFRLQGVEDIIGEGSKVLHGLEGTEPHAETFPLLIKQGPAAVMDRLRRHPEMFGRTDLWAPLAGTYKAWQFRRKVTSVLYVTLGSAAVAIALCFVALPFTRAIAASPCLTWAVLGAAVGLALGSIVLTVWLIVRVVGLPSGRVN